MATTINEELMEQVIPIAGSDHGRIPGCQSTNHTTCKGELWKCSRCGKIVCWEEGSASDDFIDWCDDCSQVNLDVDLPWRKTMTYNYSQKSLELLKLHPNLDPQTAIDRLWDKGYTNIDATVTGEGDCGCDCYVTAYRPEDKYSYVSEVLSREDRQELEAWIWAAASHLVPGFEIDDGGEVKIELTRTDKDITLAARGVVFERVENVRLDYTED